MAKKPGTNPKGEFAFFNVVYEDDSQRSNRRVPSELLGGLDGDEPARGFILEQDREIAEKSGRTPLEIKSLSRVGAQTKAGLGGLLIVMAGLVPAIHFLASTKQERRGCPGQARA